MKNILVATISALLLFAGAAFAQEQQGDEKILVSKKDLSPEQLAKVTAEQRIAQIRAEAEKAGTYAKFVQEFGVGVSEASHEVTDATIKFGRTGLGKTIMAMVAFHVLGNDVMGYIACLPMLIFLTIVFVVTWRRNCMGVSFVVEEKRETDSSQGGVRWRFWRRHVSRQYETEDEGLGSEWRYWTVGLFAAVMLLTALTMFC